MAHQIFKPGSNRGTVRGDYAINTCELLHRKALLQEQAAFLLRQEAARRETTARQLRIEARRREIQEHFNAAYVEKNTPGHVG